MSETAQSQNETWPLPCRPRQAPFHATHRAFVNTNNTMKRSHSDNDTLTLTVVHVTKTATESYVETVSRTETVFALKTRVQKHIKNLSPSFMRLIYKGGTWDDSNLVSDLLKAITNVEPLAVEFISHHVFPFSFVLFSWYLVFFALTFLLRSRPWKKYWAKNCLTVGSAPKCLFAGFKDQNNTVAVSKAREYSMMLVKLKLTEAKTNTITIISPSKTTTMRTRAVNTVWTDPPGLCPATTCIVVVCCPLLLPPPPPLPPTTTTTTTTTFLRPPRNIQEVNPKKILCDAHRHNMNLTFVHWHKFNCKSSNAGVMAIVFFALYRIKYTALKCTTNLFVKVVVITWLPIVLIFQRVLFLIVLLLHLQKAQPPRLFFWPLL